MRQLVECLLHVPYSLDVDLRFDLQLLALGLTINVSEHSNRLREWFESANVRVSSDTDMTRKFNALEALVRVSARNGLAKSRSLALCKTFGLSYGAGSL